MPEPTDFRSRKLTNPFSRASLFLRLTAIKSIHPFAVDVFFEYVIPNVVELPLGTNFFVKLASLPFAVVAAMFVRPAFVPLMVMSKCVATVAAAAKCM